MDIYTLFNQVIVPGKHFFKSEDFDESLFCQLTDGTSEAEYNLIKSILLSKVEYSGDKAQFGRVYNENNGLVVFDADSLDEDDYVYLESLSLGLFPDFLHIRVADILNQREGKFSRNLAIEIVQIAHDLYDVFFDQDNWQICYGYINHAVAVCAKINDKQLLKQYELEIHNKIIALNGRDNSYLSLKLIQLLLERKWYKISDFLPILDLIINRSSHDVERADDAFEIKISIYRRLKSESDVKKTIKEQAHYLEQYSLSVNADSNIRVLSQAEKLMIQAIRLYKDNGFISEANQAQKELKKLQSRISDSMQTITMPHDVSQTYERLRESLQNCTFKEHIAYIVQLVPFYTRKQLIEDALHPITSFFNSSIRSKTGEIVANLAPIDIKTIYTNGILNDIDEIENNRTAALHMHMNAHRRESIYGSTVLKWAVDMLNSKHNYSMEDLRFLVNENPIIPSGREDIVLYGIYHGLKDNLYLSLHILAPQVENLFRCIADQCGANTSFLYDDDASGEVPIKKIFNLPELRESYDNDILFLFDGMMGERVGANIRNKIAHGLMDVKEGNSGNSLFFLCAVMKLLSFTSYEYYDIIAEYNASQGKSE